MSPQEHYFENLLFAFAKYGDDGWDQTVESDPNIDEMTVNEHRAIKTCALYIICDVCDWDQEKLKKFLE